MTPLRSKCLRLLGAAAVLFSAASMPVLAQMAPVVDDDEVSGRHVRAHAQYLGASDQSVLDRAFDAVDRRQWDYARQLAAHLSNPAARDVLLWRIYTMKENGAAFADIDRFLASHRDWPNARAMQARAEEAMPADLMQPDQVVSWFQGRDPVSGEGMIKLGDALSRKGDGAGKTWLRKGWIEGNFTLERVAAVAARHGANFTSDDHRKRAARLVWAGEFGQANAMANWLDAEYEAVVTARIRFRQNARDAEAASARVSSALRNDPGLLFDRARWLRKRDRDAEARPLLIAASAGLDAPPPSAEDWWTERNYQAREALDDGNVHEAYLLASGHAMRKESGLPFAEAEFLAGWIALRFAGRTDAAYDHFLRLREAVTAPISVARAHFWAGRAAEKGGRAAEATRQYTMAASYPQTYYGQVAASTVNPRGTLNLPIARAAAGSAPGRAIDPLMMQAMQALADIGAEGTLRTFVLACADNLTERDQYVQLVEFLRRLSQPAMALRVAKRALQKNLAVYDVAYPVISLPVYRGEGTPPESALVMGLTRQESEFDPEATSSAGARGLMQMMPATAKLTARRHGLPYDNKSDLFTPSVNLQLGMAHVTNLLENLGGSYVLAVASYNAGEGRINQWIATYGDPRSTNADIIDWVERIPFNETRNYVQRVLENTQIYRNVMAGRDVPLLIASDLRRGGYTAVAAAQAQFSSSPLPASTAAPVTAAPPVSQPGVSPVITPGDAQLVTVVASKPVYDDPPDEPAAAPSKSKKKKAGISKKRRSSAASSGKRCKGSTGKSCRKKGG